MVSPNGATSVDWMRASLATGSQQPLRWHKVGALPLLYKSRNGHFKFRL